MYSFKNICVTNRFQSRLPLIDQIDIINNIYKPDCIILREKDLSKKEYLILAEKIIRKCKKINIELSLHTFIDVARILNHRKIHLTFSDFKNNIKMLDDFDLIGVSIHSVDEAVWANENGASYIIAGHIFSTDCKKNLDPRGTEFLSKILANVQIPTYAIGGITLDNISIIKELGVNGACMMSEYMGMI